MDTNIELFIRLENGQPCDHPILKENILVAFPNLDADNLPSDQFAKFVRVPRPQLNDYEVYVGASYVWDDSVVTEIHNTREMTLEEREIKTEQLKVRAQEILQARIVAIKSLLAHGTDDLNEEEIDQWKRCLQEHESWVLEEVSPLKPPYPPFPSKANTTN